MASVVGVEISASALRAVEIRNGSTARPSVVRAYTVDLPEGIARDGEVLNADLFQTALDNLWSKGGFSSRDVALCVGNRQTMVRQLTLPLLPPKQLRQSLPYQADHVLSSHPQDLLMDFYPQRESVGTEKRMVEGLLIAAPHKVVEKNVAVLQAAKLRVLSADLLPFAVTRLEHLVRPASSSRLEVTITADSTYIAHISGKITELIRVVAVGTGDVATAVQELEGTDAETAFETMRDVGLDAVDDDDQEVAELMRDEISAVTDAIRSTIEAIRSLQRDDFGIEEIVLTGNSRFITGFDDLIGEITGLPLRHSDAVLELTQGKYLDLEGRVSEYAAAAGVAIEGSK